MMTEELPPLSTKGHLITSQPCPSTTVADDNTSCLLEAVKSSGSPNCHRYGTSPQTHLRVGTSDRLQPSATCLQVNERNRLNINSERTESYPEGSDTKPTSIAHKFRYRGNLDGEAPILYDCESSSQCPTSNRSASRPTQPSQTTSKESTSDIDPFYNIDQDIEIASSVSNGGIVFISEDVKADQKRTCDYIRSQSVKQHKRVCEENISSKRHPPMVRTNSEPQYNALSVSTSSRGSVDLGKLASLDQQFVQSPLTKAIFLGDHALLLECIKNGEDPLLICPTSGCTFFHLIAQASTSDRELSWVPMVFLLSNFGADPNGRDKAGTSPIGIAISRKLVQIVAALLKCGAEADGHDMFQAEQIRGVVKSEMMEILRRLTPSYWSAVHDLTPFKVNRLVKAWARVNVSRFDKTLIEYAKEHAKDNTIIKLLLQNEASIELAHAVMAGDRDRVKVLLCDSAVDLNTSDTSVKNNYFEPFAPLTLFGAALKLGHIGVLNELKTAAQNRNFKGTLPSSGASSSGSVASMRGLGFSNTSSSMKNTEVVFYKGKSDEEICEIRNASKPVTSALCAIV